MYCPHCHEVISRSEIAKAVAVSGERIGRPKIERPCEHCGKSFGVTAMRKHLPICPKSTKSHTT